MSPYFPKAEERAYKCPACGGGFIPGGMVCLVAHAPGTCCHKYETPALAASPRMTFDEMRAQMLARILVQDIEDREAIQAIEREHYVPPRPPCLMGYASVFEVQQFIENLNQEAAREPRPPADR